MQQRRQEELFTTVENRGEVRERQNGNTAATGTQARRPNGVGTALNEARMKKLTAMMVLAGGLAVWAPSASAGDYPADNSGRNVRDRNEAAMTAGDQSNSESDLTITQEIRKAVMADKALSTNAHNIKIITVGAIVTLRGPVGNAGEKTSIEAKAKSVEGVKRVDNQLEIASK